MSEPATHTNRQIIVVVVVGVVVVVVVILVVLVVVVVVVVVVILVVLGRVVLERCLLNKYPEPRPVPRDLGGSSDTTSLILLLRGTLLLDLL